MIRVTAGCDKAAETLSAQSRRLSDLVAAFQLAPEAGPGKDTGTTRTSAAAGARVVGTEVA